MQEDRLSLEDQVIVALRRIVRAIDLQSRQLAEVHGITGPQLVALRAAARLGVAPIGMLARSIHLSHPTVTGILDRLERRGLVARVRDVRDRRRISVAITEAGRRLLADAPSPLQERFRERLSRLAEWERTLMLSTLQHVAALMDAGDLEASPMLATGAIDGVAPAAAEPGATRSAAAGRSAPALDEPTSAGTHGREATGSVRPGGTGVPPVASDPGATPPDAPAETTLPMPAPADPAAEPRRGRRP